MISNKVKIFIICAVIAAVFAGVTLFRNSTKEFHSPGDSSGLIIGKNAIYVSDQAPSQTLSVAVVRLEKPGFAAVHEDASGVPGDIVGISGILPAGETKNVPLISLSRMTQDGETLYVMLHLDDGDGVFDALNDKPFFDPIGADPVMMIIIISAEATEPEAVNL